MSREAHVQFWERAEVQSLRATRPTAEAFFSTLKIEFIYRQHFATHRQAHAAIFEWIEAFYNLRRCHSSLRYLSPIDFENQNI